MSLPPRQRIQIAKFASLLLAFSPAILCAYFIGENAVSVPVWDDWERGELLQKQADGELSFSDLYAAEEGRGRPLVPRALMLASNSLSDGDLRAEMALAFLAILVTAAGLYLLVARTLPAGRWRLFTALAINCALFSPAQYPVFLWAARLGFVIPGACLMIGIAALCSQRLPAAAKAGAVALAGITAVLSEPHGLFVWPILLALLLCGFGGLGGMALRASLVGGSLAWAALAGLTLGSISWTDEPRSYLIALGNPLARLVSLDARNSAPLIGAVFAGVFVGSLSLLKQYWSRPDAREALLPWAAIGVFAIAGTAPLGLDQQSALLPHQIALNVLLPISLMGMAAFWLHRWLAYARNAEIPEDRADPLVVRASVCAAFAGIAIAVWVPGWVHGGRKMEQWKSARLQAQVSLMFMNHQNPQHVTRLDRDLERIKVYAPLMDSEGWLKLPLVDELGFAGFKRDEKRMKKSDWEHATIRPGASFEGGVLRVRGHAALPDDRRAADGVLLTWRRTGKEGWKPLAVTEVIGQSAAEVYFSDPHFGLGPNLSRPRQFSKWWVEKEWPDGPKGRFMLRAWALDAEKMRAYRLGGEIILNESEEADEEGGAS